jgi:hypothetical protein
MLTRCQIDAFESAACVSPLNKVWVLVCVRAEETELEVRRVSGAVTAFWGAGPGAGPAILGSQGLCQSRFEQRSN